MISPSSYWEHPMNRTLLAMTLGAIALLAFAPTTDATPIEVCTPGNVACVTQANTPCGGPACNSYPNVYGSNADKDEVRVNAGGVAAAAGAQNLCANWFYGDYNYQGFYANGAAAGKSSSFGWYTYDMDYHWPGAPADSHGEYITFTVNDGTGQTGVSWVHRVTPSAGTDTCELITYEQGVASSHSCPASLPPPAPPAAAWGALI
jgi:hypothetical protein